MRADSGDVDSHFTHEASSKAKSDLVCRSQSKSVVKHRLTQSSVTCNIFLPLCNGSAHRGRSPVEEMECRRQHKRICNQVLNSVVWHDTRSLFSDNVNVNMCKALL